ERGRGRPDRLGAGSNRVDDRNRRHPAFGGSGGRELAVADDGEVVAAVIVRRRGDQLRQLSQGAQTLPAPQGFDGAGRLVTQPRGALVAVQFGQPGDLLDRGGQRSVVHAVDQRRGACHRRRVLGGRRAAGRGTRGHLDLRTGRTV